MLGNPRFIMSFVTEFLVKFPFQHFLNYTARKVFRRVLQIRGRIDIAGFKRTCYDIFSQALIFAVIKNPSMFFVHSWRDSLQKNYSSISLEYRFDNFIIARDVRSDKSRMDFFHDCALRRFTYPKARLRSMTRLTSLHPRQANPPPLVQLRDMTVWSKRLN